MTNEPDQPPTPRLPSPEASPGYALGQLRKALEQAARSDPGLSERGRGRAQTWLGILTGMLEGTLRPGSNTPVRGVPQWVTLEVATGGFATGVLAAEGPLLPHEEQLLLQVAGPEKQGGRALLNLHHVSAEGLKGLEALLDSGCYDLTVPEEGALLVLAWLLRAQDNAAATKLLECIGPWMPRLRFYPIPVASAPPMEDERVHLDTVGGVTSRLQAIRPNERILSQREAVLTWEPLYRGLIDMFIETVEGDIPSLEGGSRWERGSNGAFPTTGGWPCAHYPEGWVERARTLLRNCQAARSETGRRCRRSRGKDDRFLHLEDCLRRCVEDPTSLTGRDVGRLRMILACHVTAHAIPTSPAVRGIQELTGCPAGSTGAQGRIERRDDLKAQAAHAGTSTHAEIVPLLVQRLGALPPDAGLPDPAAFVGPVSPTESAAFRIPVGTTIPAPMVRRLARARTASLDEHVREHVITSGDQLARLLPLLTGGVISQAFEDPALRRLHAAIYRAYRKRRSLLLLNFGAQMQFDKLPWIAPLLDRRRGGDASCTSARLLLRRVATLAIQAYPQAILPNPLVRELGTLARSAGVDIPLVEELAADIFMGDFSPKFIAAARDAATLLDGKFYTRYYDIDWQPIRDMKIPSREEWAKQLAAGSTFAALCQARSSDRPSRGVAANGFVIEQAQILTTHNLASLFLHLDLASDMVDSQLPHQILYRIMRRMRIRPMDRHTALIHWKNCAYAWRQMVFHLSFFTATKRFEFLHSGTELVSRMPNEAKQRFLPLWNGLRRADAGKPVEAPGENSRRFLGWVTNPG